MALPGPSARISQPSTECRNERQMEAAAPAAAGLPASQALSFLGPPVRALRPPPLPLPAVALGLFRNSLESGGGLSFQGAPGSGCDCLSHLVGLESGVTGSLHTCGPRGLRATGVVPSRGLSPGEVYPGLWGGLCSQPLCDAFPWRKPRPRGRSGVCKGQSHRAHSQPRRLCAGSSLHLLISWLLVTGKKQTGGRAHRRLGSCTRKLQCHSRARSLQTLGKGPGKGEVAHRQ